MYIIIAFFIYFAVLLALALLFHKKQTTSSEFITGNRSLSFWLVAISAHASDMSSWLFMALPMTIFTIGLSQAWIAVGLLIGMFLNWHFVAKRLRIMTENYDCDTLSSFFEKRFKDTSSSISLVSAIAMVIFLTHYLSAGFIAMGDLLESLFGLNYMLGLSIAVCVVIIYTFVGGFTTVAWTDLFQGIFLLLMILLVPYVALGKIGGWTEITTIAQQKNISLSLIPDWSFHSITSLFLLAMGWGLGYFGMPHIITKFMGIKNASELNKSKWLGISWQAITLGAAIAVGLIGIAYFPEGLANPELVFIEMVKGLFHPFMVGFILCGIIAANMSTMDSQILVCSSILSKDLYKYFHAVPPPDKKILWVSKISVVLVSLIALLLAFKRSTSIAATVSYSWSGLGSAFGPLILMSLYSKKINKYGALAGIVMGTCVVMVWPTIGSSITSYNVMPMIPGFFCSLASIYAVSSLTAKAAFRDSKLDLPIATPVQRT